MAAAYLPQAAPTTHPPKGWIATLVVAVLMFGIVAGGFIAEGAVPNQPPRPVNAGNGVVITPSADWEFAGKSDDGTAVLLTNGSASLAVETSAGTDVERALNDLRDEWLASGTVTASDVANVDLASGLHGMRFEYSGTFDDVPTPVEGAVTGLVGANVVVLFDGWSGIGDFTGVRDDIDGMITTAMIP